MVLIYYEISKGNKLNVYQFKWSDIMFVVLFITFETTKLNLLHPFNYDRVYLQISLEENFSKPLHGNP
jgi:hypothetical protein